MHWLVILALKSILSSVIGSSFYQWFQDTKGGVWVQKKVDQYMEYFAEKYNLEGTDFWKHKQSGKWIITHDACEKIASKENIILVDWETLNSERDFCRFLITMAKEGKEIASIGEASKENCQSKYYGSMAEKRGVDRCILKLINAY